MRPVSVIHPDYLHERVRVGGAALSPDEWRRFGAHLASCPACAWERALTDDFEREGALVASSEDLGGLIEGALARAGFEGAPLAPSPPARPSVGRWARWATGFMVAAAMGAVVLPAMRVDGDPRREDVPLAVSDASLDAGANGAPSGGDS